MEAESSQAVRNHGKRPARVTLSDNESEASPRRANGTAKRRRSSHVDEGDSDLDILTEDEPGYGELVIIKRETMKGHGGGGGDHEDEDQGSVNGVGDDRPLRPIGFRPDYERGSDGFVAGSITRIKMKHFMTYDFVEFHPGPHLNMILGPNGTGKSTIAAAIAIGLGFHPKVMGRASDLKSYVKQGTEIAETEIELKGRPGKRNPVIWRRFTRETDQSEWRINGEASTKKAATEIVSEMCVQANNLCSFLPQDKVAEFAKMVPVIVLKETMRAAGDPRLTRWHETLVEKGGKAKDIEGVLEKDIERRDLLQSQVDRLEPQVRNFRARQDQEFEREVLELLVMVKEHIEVKDKHFQLTEERKALKKKEKESAQRRKPLLDLAEHVSNKMHKAEARAKLSDDKLKEFHKSIRAFGKRMDDAIEDGEGVDAQLSVLNKKMRNREEEKARYRSRIQNAQRILDSPQADVQDAMQRTAQEKRDIVAKGKQAFSEASSLREECQESTSILEKLTMDIDNRLKRQQELSSVEIQRENTARDLDPSINFALDWLEKHGHELESTVHKPPMVSVNVSNHEYAWQVEMCTNLQQRKTFICQSQRDYERMLSLNGTVYEPRRRADGRISSAGKVALNLAVIDYNDQTANPPRPCTHQQMADLGLDGFAIDFVDAEGPVIAYLNQYANMHRAAVTQRAGTEINTEALIRAGITTWITGTDSNRAIQSRYGKKDYQINTSGPAAAKAFNLAVDQGAVKKIVDEIAGMKKAKRDREAPHTDLIDRHNKARDKAQSTKDQSQAIERELASMKEQVGLYSKAKVDKELAEKRLRDLEEEPSVEALRAELRKKKLKYAQRQAEPLQAYQASCEEAVSSLSDTLIKDAFNSIMCQVNDTAIQQRLATGDADASSLSRQIEILTESINEQRIAATTLGQHFMSELHERHPTVQAELKKRSRGEMPPLEELQHSLAATIADLEASIGVDPNVVARFEKLSKELEKLQSSVRDLERDLARAKHSINKILSEFDPALDMLVDVVSRKFAAAFERVGCTGEVRINRIDGDFAAWGIQILVSYRDGDNLQILTGSLQSGGERSLATVTYLMSLSEMARTPFSLVDEINQGMDQKAERNVHNQLVEVTCGEDAGQYFLITPKLLTNLRYHERMKVLVINNGTWLPDSVDKSMRYGDLKSCLARYKSNDVLAH